MREKREKFRRISDVRLIFDILLVSIHTAIFPLSLNQIINFLLLPPILFLLHLPLLLSPFPSPIPFLPLLTWHLTR